MVSRIKIYETLQTLTCFISCICNDPSGPNCLKMAQIKLRTEVWSSGLQEVSKSKMLSLAYMNDTSVLSIKTSVEDSWDRLTKLDSYYSDKLILMLFDRVVVSNKTFVQFERLKQIEWASAWNWLIVNTLYIYRYIPWSGKYILINIERVNKHSVTILGLRVVTPAGLEPG